MSNKRYLKAVGMVLCMALLTWVLGSSRGEAQETFAGKTVRIMVGYPPGGGHDLEARVMARHLGKYIPGNPSVIVQNMPGAGGMIMITYIHSRAKPDGLTSGIAPSSHFMQSLLRTDLKFDLGRMPAIWAVGGVNVDMVRDFLNAKTARDLLKVDPAKIVIGAREKRGSSCLKGKLAMELLGIKGYKAVCAYPGTAVIKAAMERGEVSFFNGTDAHLVGGGAFVDLAERGLVIPLWQTGILTPEGKIVRSATVPDLPTFYEVYKEVHGKPPSGPMWDSWKAISLDLNKLLRILLVAPGTPQKRVNLMRRAIDQMAEDPAFVADWERIFGQKLAPVRISAEEGERLKNDFLRPAPWQEFLRKFVEG
ncbi:MAG: Bug family tripartite tricarboxylate transporter substrate binding protein [Candidatus Binatia bacterium]